MADSKKLRTVHPVSLRETSVVVLTRPEEMAPSQVIMVPDAIVDVTIKVVETVSAHGGRAVLASAL